MKIRKSALVPYMKSNWHAVAYGTLYGVLTSLIAIITSFMFDIFSQQSPLDVPNVNGLVLATIFLGGIIISPIVETVIFQLLIFESIGYQNKNKFALSFFFSVIFFSASHILSGVDHAAVMLVVGTMFSSIYVAARKNSKLIAFTTTTATHTSHNFIIFLLLLKYPELG